MINKAELDALVVDLGFDKLPELEAAVVGACIGGNMGNDYLAGVHEMIAADMITEPRIRAVYETFVSMLESGVHLSAIDEISVFAEMDSRGWLGRLGRMPRTVLSELAVRGAWGGEPLTHYAGRLVEIYKRRKLAELADKLKTARGDEVDHTTREAMMLSLLGSELRVESLTTIAKRIFRAMSDAHSGATEIKRSWTGFPDLDRVIGGLRGGELILLGGRPSMGKSALALNIAAHVCRTSPVILFSLEMTATALMTRLVASESGVSAERLGEPKRMTPDDFSRVGVAINKIVAGRMLISDDARATTADIRSRVEAAIRQGGCSLVVIDYLQLIRTPGKAYSREREVAQISADLKSLAKDYDVPVLCLAQLNRFVEKGRDNRPRLGNLRESGSLEQDADKVLFVHREHYYDPRADPAQAEIIVAKNREGESGRIIKVGWDGGRTKFYSQAPEVSR